MRQRPEVVGYAGKSGNVRAYKLLWRGIVKKGKNAGREMAHLQSFGKDPIDFWVDAEKLTDAPPIRSPRYCDECDTWDGHDITCAFG